MQGSRHLVSTGRQELIDDVVVGLLVLIISAPHNSIRLLGNLPDAPARRSILLLDEFLFGYVLANTILAPQD